MSVGVSVLVFEPETLKVMADGAVSPDAPLGVEPGVIVNTQVSDTAIVPQLAGLIVVPLGNAGDGE